jgi:steroid 5-alpha reductase family enzyme
MAIWYVITIIVTSQQLAFHQHYGAMMIMVALVVEANGTPNLYGHMTKQVAS